MYQTLFNKITNTQNYNYTLVLYFVGALKFGINNIREDRNSFFNVLSLISGNIWEPSLFLQLTSTTQRAWQRDALKRTLLLLMARKFEGVHCFLSAQVLPLNLFQKILYEAQTPPLPNVFDMDCLSQHSYCLKKASFTRIVKAILRSYQLEIRVSNSAKLFLQFLTESHLSFLIKAEIYQDASINHDKQFYSLKSSLKGTKYPLSGLRNTVLI